METINYNQWNWTDQSHLINESEISTEFNKHLLGCFLKNTLTWANFVVVMNFSENYSIVVHDEVQSFHWTKGHETLHPFAIYYKKDGKIHCTSCIIVSDIMNHNVIAVKLLILKFVNFVIDNLHFIKKIFYFSDGSAAQDNST